MVVGAITAVSAAIISAYGVHKKLGNSHTENMKSLMCQHDQTMEDLKNQRISETQRHERLMKLLGILETFVTNLGKAITEAEYHGCKGLPGKELYLCDCSL